MWPCWLGALVEGKVQDCLAVGLAWVPPLHADISHENVVELWLEPLQVARNDTFTMAKGPNSSLAKFFHSV
eukprot:158823-Amphidinium_carterae.1